MIVPALNDADWCWHDLDLVACRQFQRCAGGMRVFVVDVESDRSYAAMQKPPIERQMVVYRPFGMNTLYQMPIAEFFELIEVAAGVRLPRYWPTGALIKKEHSRAGS